MANAKPVQNSAKQKAHRLSLKQSEAHQHAFIRLHSPAAKVERWLDNYYEKLLTSRNQASLYPSRVGTAPRGDS